MNRKIGIIVFLICFCFYLMPNQAMAASTSDAVEPITPEKACSLTLSYRCGEVVLSGVEVKLYRVAEVSADFKYKLTQLFAASGLVLDGIRTVGEWNIARSTLETYIIANDISPEFTSITSTDGQASFSQLKTGMYLAIVGNAEQNGLTYRFDSSLIALPGLGQDGIWQYQVEASAKGEALPPVEPDKTIDYKVLKLWNGEEDKTSRPKSIEIELFCNGISYKSVILAEENNWSYTWSAKDDGSDWTVAERNVPKGYTATVEEKGTSFVLTNTWTPTIPDKPNDPPQTGDTSNMLLYALLMIGSGCGLIILGLVGKKPHS